MKKSLLLLISLCAWSLFSIADNASATLYRGRVVDEKGEAIPFATVYPIQHPEDGTATNDDGRFSIDTKANANEQVIVSFVGFEKQSIPLKLLRDTTPYTITLHEQPFELEETVVQSKRVRIRGKRKATAEMLHQVYNRMEQDFPTTNTRYHIVSDVKMDVQAQAWGMEQLIMQLTTLPDAAFDGRDSAQVHATMCKRYFKPTIRSRATKVLAGSSLDKMGGQMRAMAHSVDSGVAIHRELWKLGDVRYDLRQAAQDLRHWKITNENDGELVLTYTNKHTKYMGVLKTVLTQHFILDQKTLSINRYSAKMQVEINIPFGYKMKPEHLELLNLLNMKEEEIKRFRVQHIEATVLLNTLYQDIQGHHYVLEKNMDIEAVIDGSKKQSIPFHLQATQRANQVDTKGVKPLPQTDITRRIARKIVEIY